ncbi:MAG: hypothetical protein J1E40_06825 [Oscillospiraceae bacterium]|nr:hypothetical protein [Oscillospiraceae bacterium]
MPKKKSKAIIGIFCIVVLILILCFTLSGIWWYFKIKMEIQILDDPVLELPVSDAISYDTDSYSFGSLTFTAESGMNNTKSENIFAGENYKITISIMDSENAPFPFIYSIEDMTGSEIETFSKYTDKPVFSPYDLRYFQYHLSMNDFRLQSNFYAHKFYMLAKKRDYLCNYLMVDIYDVMGNGCHGFLYLSKYQPSALKPTICVFSETDPYTVYWIFLSSDEDEIDVQRIYNIAGSVTVA